MLSAAQPGRITVLLPAFPRVPGGGAKVAYEYANALARDGYEVTVVHALGHRSGGLGRWVDRAKSRVRDLQSGLVRRRIRWMPIDPRVRMICTDSLDERTCLPPADLRIGTFWRTTEFLANRSPDGARVMQLIQAYETWAGPEERVNAVWRLGVHAAVVSSALYQRGLDLGVAPELLHLVPNGLDHSVYRPGAPVAGRAPQLTFLTHPAPVKGQAEAIAVAERVHAQRPDIPIVAFGSAPRPASLPAFVHYVHRPIGRDLVRRVYDRTSVFLCSSRSEGWGFPSMEAMACGAALVSTRNGGVDDFAVDGESALLCDVGDVDALAEAVLALFADEPRRLALAEAGMRRVQPFTWEASAAAFGEAVRAALGTGEHAA